MASLTKRTTLYLDPDLHKALRLKAVETSRSLSELVNEAIRESLAKIQDNQDFNSGLKRGLKDARAKRGRFVE